MTSDNVSHSRDCRLDKTYACLLVTRYTHSAIFMHLSLSCPTTPSTGFGWGMGGDLFIQSCPRGGAFDNACMCTMVMVCVLQ